MIMQPHRLMVIDEDGNDTKQTLAIIHPASAEAVKTVLTSEEDDNGRSPWCWVRLQNGDLLLGVFPQGDTCEVMSQGDAVAPPEI